MVSDSLVTTVSFWYHSPPKELSREGDDYLQKTQCHFHFHRTGTGYTDVDVGGTPRPLNLPHQDPKDPGVDRGCVGSTVGPRTRK